MPIIHLSRVTKTIIKLLQVGLDPSALPTTVVSSIPPDEVTSAGSTKQVSVHLLHVLETPEYKNFPPGPRVRNVPIQQLPMGLVLQYVVSVAREQVDEDDQSTDQDALDAQDILGFIARLLHDFPVITPTTAIEVGPPAPPASVLILDPELREANESIHLILRPAQLEENLNFWATQNQKLARACLFIEARVAVLQPKPPEILPGIVLSVGNFIFPNSGPQLTTSRNALSFQPPNTTEFASITASPARVAIFPDDTSLDTPGAPDGFGDDAKLTIEAVGLSPGKRILLLRREDQQLSIDLDEPHEDNTNWQFAMPSGSISLRFRTTVRAMIGNPPALRIVVLVPGIYGARIMLQDDRLGSVRPRTSNEIAFAAIAQITEVGKTIDPAEAANDYTLSVAAAYLNPPAPGATTPPTVLPATAPEVDLAVGGRVLTRVDTMGAFDTATENVFFVEAAHIRFKLPDGMLPGQDNEPSTDNPLPVQLLVNSASSTPAWLTEVATG